MTGVVGPGTSSILDLATTHDIHMIGFTQDQAAKIFMANATYSSVEAVYREASESFFR